MRRVLLPLSLLLAPAAAHAQWLLQSSPVTTDLRGIHHIGHGVAWASGTQGTVLRTTDSGAHWQACAVPPDAARLDFRAVQALDKNSAVVMSSGPGALSRLYKTTDGCRTWKLVFTNPDPGGFWDALRFSRSRQGVLIGDPVDGRFPVFLSENAGDTWRRFETFPIPADPAGQALFAASNSSLLLDRKPGKLHFVTGGVPALITIDLHCRECLQTADLHTGLAAGPSGGGYSLAAGAKSVMVAVGGDYKQPAQTSGTAAWFQGGRWQPAVTPPHGYRSAVAYEAAARAWIATGPNGTDVSTDEGRHWQALEPSAQDAKDADKNWNALSLPFAVGPRGRIGMLRPEALKKAR